MVLLNVDDRQTNRQTNEQTNRQTNGQTNRQSDITKYSVVPLIKNVLNLTSKWYPCQPAFYERGIIDESCSIVILCGHRVCNLNF